MHQHTYDTNGNITCCSLEEKIDRLTSPPSLVDESEDRGDRQHISKTNNVHGDERNHADFGKAPAIISFVLLVTGLALDHFIPNEFFDGWIRIVWYLGAYFPVAYSVIREAIEALGKGQVFTEFFLMSIATIGAFAIGEYPEGVAVMLFYAVGELFQSAAVKKAKNNITALLDVRPKIASVNRNGVYEEVHPELVSIDETIKVKVGEKIPLDGKLVSNSASVDSAAITGESKPLSITKGEKVLAGSINLEGVIEIQVTKEFKDSSISKILDLVQNATAKKAKTELLIRRLAKIYTPIVVYIAIAICVLPFFLVDDYQFRDWLYRSLIFLVISCPCALVISIPLGYFGGLGAASRNGILFKGATFMDQLTSMDTLVMDKTGTVTKGLFSIKDISTKNGTSEKELMDKLLALESESTHPIAKAIMQYGNSNFVAKDVQEVAGKGMMGEVDGSKLLVGNAKLLRSNNIEIPSEIYDIVDTIVMVAIDGKLAGYVTLADQLKDDAQKFVNALPKYGFDRVVMLSGDKDSITQSIAKELGIKYAKGGLLPADKLNKVEELKAKGAKVLFIGDGVNDAPVLAASDIGVAMGAMGSDVAIETADIIIQTDEPSKILTAVNISKATQKIIWQNISMAFGVKVIVLTLGAFGMATMWEAVFADVGVALLAILNAVRIQGKNYHLKSQ
ncbi:MAG: Cd2+/Zn2+-exporting ATPase [Saprospiraceae bacterium]|jgi:Cd2+/Zn2+-exporting ATPase